MNILIRIFQGVAAKQGKNSGVKKLLLIAAVPGVPENHFNVKTILDQVNMEAIEFTVAADVKMCKYHLYNILNYTLLSFSVNFDGEVWWC